MIQFPKLTDTIKHLVIINLIMFIGPKITNLDLSNFFNLHFPKNELFQFWQYFTSIFMHGSFGHLFFNMIGLWMFGSSVEYLLGSKRFLFLYFSAGIGAALIHTAVHYFQFNPIYEIFVNAGLTDTEIIDILNAQQTSDPRLAGAITQLQFTKIVTIFNTSALGASGAIFGIFAASAVYFPNHKILIFPIPFPLPNKLIMISLIISDLVLGIFSLPGDNVGRFAHVGGAIVGFIITFYWKKIK
ncbi:Rhomboid family protein [Tenacibaculum sp. MAR_2009_124]|uniref:rhomboid family intramembrane serine protease n=1 Tax=Tenacibaculum sp. MAR_2009_124 TaxID=1250059 RepID=UPI000894BC93|nr:rhomboid family intramembrane serine protease [Tenacibaculum sp. MAR_2009_124]SEB35303.1 Rhomboid family protein [Tenacibaculum sp. MAR_2009_124]